MESFADDIVGLLQALGPTRPRELIRRLGVSQPVFSRGVAAAGDRLLIVGRARATIYAARRRVDGVTMPVALYAIAVNGVTRRLGSLHAIGPRGFYIESLEPSLPSAFSADLPWFLHDVRPSGFLGRQVPRLHPDLGLPVDITVWSADDVLRYLSRYGADLVGQLVVGEGALQLALQRAASAPSPIAASRRAEQYRDLAARNLFAPVGSSAGGEQPKFLAVTDDGQVLVKLSPELEGPVAERVADLLVCEHLALGVLEAAGDTSAVTELVRAPKQLFLEVRRFDRAGDHGRRGVLSLAAVDAEHTGSGGDWTTTADALERQGIIDAATAQRIRFRDAFGELIANDDRHAANLSFVADGVRLEGLTPVYDMAPMLYRPLSNALPRREFNPRPHPSHAAVWRDACVAAETFWKAVSQEKAVSPGFRELARSNAEAVRGAADLARLLPAS